MINSLIKKNEEKVVDTVDVEDIGEKKVFCRCWKSAKVSNFVNSTYDYFTLNSSILYNLNALLLSFPIVMDHIISTTQQMGTMLGHLLLGRRAIDDFPGKFSFSMSWYPI